MIEGINQLFLQCKNYIYFAKRLQKRQDFDHPGVFVIYKIDDIHLILAA
jgi:hypothetical protein